MHHHISTEQCPRPAGAYSQAVAAGEVLFTAGFGSQDPSTGDVVGDSIGEQTAQVMRNVEAALTAGGFGWRDVVKTTVHLADLHRDFGGFNATYEEQLSPPYPARTTVRTSADDGHTSWRNAALTWAYARLR